MATYNTNPLRENLRHSEARWLSGNMDYVVVAVLATLCVSCDYCVSCRLFVQVQILQFDHFHHCCCYLGCYAMYCSPCAFYDMAEDMEPGTGVGLIKIFLEWFRIFIQFAFSSSSPSYSSFASKNCPCDHYPRCSGDAPCPCHQVSKVLR